MVRCERCGNEWVATRDTDTASGNIGLDVETLGVMPLPRVMAMDRLTASMAPEHRRVGLLAAWVATAMVLASGTTAAIVWRSDMVRAWPASARLLGSPAALPVHANQPGARAP
jgi:hypothetical protein